MAYFKHDGVVVKANSAPLQTETHNLKAIVDGWLLPLKELPVGAEIQGLCTDCMVPWEEATELEYLVYSSQRLRLIDHASDEIRGLIWALNHAPRTALRLGVNDPETALPVKITTIQEKVRIIAMTQHWYADDIPSVAKDNNAAWSNWIIQKRSEAPFIYLGGVIDNTEE